MGTLISIERCFNYLHYHKPIPGNELYLHPPASDLSINMTFVNNLLPKYSHIIMEGFSMPDTNSSSFSAISHFYNPFVTSVSNLRLLQEFESCNSILSTMNKYMYMHVCTYVCICTPTPTPTHTHIHTHTHTKLSII